MRTNGPVVGYSVDRVVTDEKYYFQSIFCLQPDHHVLYNIIQEKNVQYLPAYLWYPF